MKNIDLVKQRLLVISIILIYLFYFATHINTIHAVDAQNPSPVSTLPTELDLAKQQYEFLKGQASDFEDRVDRERVAFLSLLGVLAIIGSGSYLLTIRDIKKQAKQNLEKCIVDEGANLKENAKSWVKSVVDQEFGLSRSILILASKKQHAEVKKLAVRLLERRGFTKIRLDVPGTTNLTADIIVFWYNDDLDKELDKLVASLEKTKSELPVIAYYRGPVGSAKFKQYMWGTYANSPMTLVSWVFTILTSFYRRGDE